MSNDDKNDVLSSSGFVLVTVKNVSWRFPCSDFGVPLRSRILQSYLGETHHMHVIEPYLLEVRK